MALGIVTEAQTSAAVLGHNFPESRWYKDAHARMTSRGLSPSENKDSWISKAFRSIGLGYAALSALLLVACGSDSGSSAPGAHDVEPGAKLLWSYDLTEDLALSGNVNFAVPTSDTGRFFQSAASVSLSYGLTDRLGVYTEYFGFFPNDRGGDCAHYANGGFTFLVTDNLQFDIRSGVGLNEEADDCFVGTGFAIRF